MHDKCFGWGGMRENAAMSSRVYNVALFSFRAIQSYINIYFSFHQIKRENNNGKLLGDASFCSVAWKLYNNNRRHWIINQMVLPTNTIPTQYHMQWRLNSSTNNSRSLPRNYCHKGSGFVCSKSHCQCKLNKFLQIFDIWYRSQPNAYTFRLRHVIPAINVWY